MVERFLAVYSSAGMATRLSFATGTILIATGIADIVRRVFSKGGPSLGGAGSSIEYYGEVVAYVMPPAVLIFASLPFLGPMIALFLK